MKIVDLKHEILFPLSDETWLDMHKLIERAARTCYRSEGAVTEDSYKILIRKLVESGHHAMLEHAMISVLFTSDIGVSREAHRHRMAAHGEESTRYCNYSKDKFGNEVSVVVPIEILSDPKAFEVFTKVVETSEWGYMRLLELGLKPQIARSVLTLATKTEYVITANPREWMHIQKLRTAPDAHPMMVRMMKPLFEELAERMPVLFKGG